MKDDVLITDSLAEQFEEVQSEAQTSSEAVVIELHPVEEESPVATVEEPLDSRFEDSVPHADQAEE